MQLFRSLLTMLELYVYHPTLNSISAVFGGGIAPNHSTGSITKIVSLIVNPIIIKIDTRKRLPLAHLHLDLDYSVS